MAQLSDAAKRLLDAPNFGHLATLQPDGAPKVEPVWVSREADRVLVTTDRRSLKGQNMDRDPRVALSVTDAANPYDQLLIRGNVVEVRDDSDLETLDAMAHQYLNGPFPRRKWPSRAVYVIEPDVARHYRSPLTHEPAGQEDPR